LLRQPETLAVPIDHVAHALVPHADREHGVDHAQRKAGVEVLGVDVGRAGGREDRAAGADHGVDVGGADGRHQRNRATSVALMGHGDVRLTSRVYTHVSVEDLRAAIEG